MYSIDFLASRASDQPVEVINFAGNQLSDAIERARSLVANTRTAGLMPQPGRPTVIGFRILSNDKQEVHREYVQGV
jgi:hypothetical protein